jgi:hypothetical protein
MRLHRLAFPTCTAFLALGAACSSTDPGGLPTTQVRLLNGSTQSVTLDLVVGGQVVAQGIVMDEASSFEDAPSGSQTIALRSSGSGTVLSSVSTTLIPGARYTVMASGTASSLTPSIASDTGAVNPDRANLRIINVVDNPPNPADSSTHLPLLIVDVYVTAPGAGIDTKAPRMSLDASWPRYSTLLYFDPGSWIVRFTSAGTKTVLAETGSIAIGAGQVRAIKLSRTAGGGWTTSVITEP